MTTRAFKSVVIALSLFPWIPNAIALYKLDLHWDMEWNNEVLAWSLIFGVASLCAVGVALHRIRSFPIFCGVAVALNIAFVASLLYEAFHGGLGPSSKGDDAELHLLDFWRYL